MARILVLGAGGLLGTTLARWLHAGDHAVVCHARRGAADVSVDLTDVARVHAALDNILPDVVINVAALTDVDECERKPQQAYLANVHIVENVAAWVRHRGGATHLIQVSTDQVYNGSGPHLEEDVCLSNYYAFSKYAGELAALSASGTVLRTNFFGPSERPGRVSFSDWLVTSLTDEVPITVFDDVCFSPLSLTHLVQLIELLIVKHRPGVFNLGSREGMSKADFAFKLADVLGLATTHMTRGSSTQMKLDAFRPSDMTMDSTRFQRTFGVSLPTLEQEIQSMHAEYIHEAR